MAEKSTEQEKGGHWEICPRCGGTGREGDHNCPACNGTGRVWVYD